MYNFNLSGTASQSDIKISSSIAINVTDLKRKIIGLERQLSAVSKHCLELGSFESIASRKSNSSILVEKEKHTDVRNTQIEPLSKHKLDETPTEILYKPPEVAEYEKGAHNDIRRKISNNTNGSQIITMNSEYPNNRCTKLKKKKSKFNDSTQNLHSRKTVSAYENLASAYSTSSFHTVIDSKINRGFNDTNYLITRHHPRPRRNDYIDVETAHKNKTHSKDVKTGKCKAESRQLDDDFIADIIRRQYKPVKMFGKRESDISQFSEPICRDQEYSVRQDIQEDPELCSCCYDQRPLKLNRRHRLNEMRSACDTRLYRTRRRSYKKHNTKHLDSYNNSEFYDLIPVKEKTSPKSRKKFVEDTMMAYDCYREVPPSPRTFRPQLNLKAQYYAEFEDYMARKHLKTKCSPNKLRAQEGGTDIQSDESYNRDDEGNIVKERLLEHNKIHVQRQQQPENNVIVNSLQEPNVVNIPNITVDTPHIKTQDTNVSINKTDKALCEIKDILHNFLQEIKKEATASQCDKSDVTSKAAETGIINHQQHATANTVPNSGQSFNNYNPAHCGLTSFVAPFTNTCCYPILPVCPMSCMQNGYVVPKPSLTCTKCANNIVANNEKPITTEICTPETEELIKKIYKYVTQSPRDRRTECDFRCKQKEAKLQTTRSVGGGATTFMHDVKVGTPTMKYYSKSCEAIGSRMISDAYYSTTNPSYSDTVLEKLSLEVTPTDTISETDCTADITSGEKNKQNRFMNELRSLGIKRKKKDAIEELSESDSTIEVEGKSKPSPFRQEVTNYMMNNQQYFHPPPIPPTHSYQDRPYEYQKQQPPYFPGGHHRPVQEIYNPHLVKQQTIHEHKDHHYHPTSIPTAPPYSQSFDNYVPPPRNIPLCLKEIEVKSIGTQSDRKMSFFEKMKSRIQVPAQSAGSEEYPQKNCSTQTSQNKPGLFSWKELEKKPNKNTNPMAFSYLKQKQLAEGDMNMRNAMLKKLFYKKNPFSPRNLLVRTIMGKDKSSFGEAPTMYRPKMFF